MTLKGEYFILSNGVNTKIGFGSIEIPNGEFAIIVLLVLKLLYSY